MAHLKTLLVDNQAQAATAPAADNDLVRQADLQALTGFQSAPATPSSTGLKGALAADTNYFYAARAANTWVRIPEISGWSAATLPAAGKLWLAVGSSSGWRESVIDVGVSSLLGFDGSGNPVMIAQSSVASAGTTLAAYGITDAQPLDADLTALAALSGTGIPRRTGSNTWAMATAGTDYLAPAAIGSTVQGYSANLTTYAGIAPSANVQTLLGAADFAGVRTALSLVPGTNVQAYSFTLATYAGITPSANVQTLLGSADTAAFVTTLGLVISTNVQAYSSALTTYAGIAPSANVQTLLGAANTAAFVSTLGLTIGANTQAYSANLTTFAGIAPSANVQTLLGSASTAAFVSTLGLIIGTNIQAFRTELGKVHTQGADIASASSIDIGAATGDLINITGTTTIGSLGTGAAGLERTLRFTGALTLTHSSNIIVPGGADIGTAGGDVAGFRSLGSGVWFCTYYTRASGSAMSTALLAANNLSDVANAATALTNLGAQAASANLTSFAGITPSANMLAWLASSTYATMRSGMGLAIGTNVQAYSVVLSTYAGIAPSSNVQTFLGQSNTAGMVSTLGLTIGTNTQAYSANLTTFSGIAPAANTVTFLGAADYSAMRTQLGLVIGTNVQAFSAELGAVAAISGTGLIKRTGTATWSAATAGTDYLAPAAIGVTVQGYVLELTKVGVTGTAIASASSIDIGAATGQVVHITGTTTITALGTAAAGIFRILIFDGNLTVTNNNTSLQLPLDQDLSTSPGLLLIMLSLGSGNWRCVYAADNVNRTLYAAIAGASSSSFNDFFNSVGAGSKYGFDSSTGALLADGGNLESDGSGNIYPVSVVIVPIPVSSLPEGESGKRLTVNDSTVALGPTTVGATVVGGGAFEAPVVFCNGAWVLG